MWPALGSASGPSPHLQGPHPTLLPAQGAPSFLADRGQMRPVGPRHPAREEQGFSASHLPPPEPASGVQRGAEVPSPACCVDSLPSRTQTGNPGVALSLPPGLPAVLSLPNAVGTPSDQGLSSPCLTPVLAGSVPKAAHHAGGLGCRGLGARCLGLTLEGPTLLLSVPTWPSGQLCSRRPWAPSPGSRPGWGWRKAIPSGVSFPLTLIEDAGHRAFA